jgi:hypothetical protein
MKRLVYLLIAVSLMLALVPAAVSADTEEDPMEVDLLAGQTMDVGDVKVWNDGDYLYVEYETSGWCLTETHLHVAASLNGIPQTKKGNPIPGQFEYSMEHKPCVRSYTYQIPLMWDPSTELYIAAHGAAGEVKTATILSNAGDTVYGPLGSNPGLTGDWGEAKAAVVAVNPLSSPWNWGDETIPGAKWISTAASTEEPCVDSWRKFTETFDVPGSPLYASLMVNADNEFWAYLNGEFVGTDDQIFDGGTSITGVETYDSIIPLEGSNWLEFIVKNWGQCSGNPNGLVYKTVVEYLYGAETAWGAGSDFPGKNWATYFTYTVQPPPLSGYGVVNSVPLNYGDGGWAGWSVPTDKVVLGGGFALTGGPAAVSVPGTPGSAWPHYTFGAGEYGWVVRDDPDGASSYGSTVYAVYADMPAGYEIVTSSAMAFGDGGYGGWSCPAGKVVIGGGFEATDRVAVSAPGTPGSVWPHYTFGDAESGWVIRDAQDGSGNTITVYAICADMPAGYEVVNSAPLNYGDGGWAGWSCPAGKVVTGGGFALTGLAAAVSVPGTPGSAWPHYTFGAGEYGWVVRDAPDGATSYGSTVYAICATY